MWFISSGNAAVIKPSEVSAHTAKVMEDLLPLYIDKVRKRLETSAGKASRNSVYWHYYTGIVLF